VNVRSVPGILTTALLSAGNAVGGGGAPGTGGVYAQLGRSAGMGPTGAAGAGAVCCAMAEAPNTTSATGIRTLCILPILHLLKLTNVIVWRRRAERLPPTLCSNKK
jgi:hypothetical protein